MAMVRGDALAVKRKKRRKLIVNSLFKSSVPTYKNGYTQNQKTAK